MIRAIASQYAEVCAFLWTRRAAATTAPHYDLEALAAMDERLDAHIDGLRIAGKIGWSICALGLGEGGEGELFTAAVLAFESRRRDLGALVLDRAEGPVELSAALAAALGWLPYTDAAPWIQELLGATSPALQRVGLAAAAIHRRDPGASLERALGSDDPGLRRRALRALGELGRIDRLEHLRAEMASPDEGCRLEAAWSAAVLGDMAAIPVLLAIATGGGASAERACRVAFRRMPIGKAHERLAAFAAPSRLFCVAAGALGDPALIRWLVEAMTIPELARVSGEAFTTISGIALRGRWRGGRPQGFRSGPTDDPEDDDVAMDPDDPLPWPRAEVARAWLDAGCGGLAPGVRHLLGRPITRDVLRSVLEHGSQQHRAAAALELAAASPGGPLFEVRAPATRQIALLRDAAPAAA